MPVQKPGASKQDYGTPSDLMAAITRTFGPISWDLAAHSGNAKSNNYFDERANSLVQQWHRIPGLLWLNPPFSKIAPWAKKCADESRLGAEILFLVPAGVGTNWYWNHVAPYARVLCLSPRPCFDGHVGKNGKPEPFPKDIILACYGLGLEPGFERWNWKPAAPKTPRPKAAA